VEQVGLVIRRLEAKAKKGGLHIHERRMLQVVKRMERIERDWFDSGGAPGDGVMLDVARVRGAPWSENLR
jgi:hypothetical protein